MENLDKKIRAVIIDDEPGCVSNLRYYIEQYCPGIEVVASANTANDMFAIFSSQTFDIAFLDIEIFDENIFDIINKNGINCEIVFVTAYEQYAVKAFKVNALDYILKPLSQADVVECYERIKRRLEEKHEVFESGSQSQPLQSLERIIIKQGENIFVVKQEDIIYLKAKGFYTQMLFMVNGKEATAIISKPIGTLEKEYDTNMFYRVHKSYLINVNKVTGVVRSGVISVKIVNNEIIPVAKRRVNDFLSLLKHA